MSSLRTQKLQKECERLSALQRKAQGAKYLELDRQWSRVAVLLNKSRLRDVVNASNTGLQADACPECRGLGYWVDTTALRVECRACGGSGRAAKA